MFPVPGEPPRKTGGQLQTCSPLAPLRPCGSPQLALSSSQQWNMLGGGAEVGATLPGVTRRESHGCPGLSTVPDPPALWVGQVSCLLLRTHLSLSPAFPGDALAPTQGAGAVWRSPAATATPQMLSDLTGQCERDSQPVLARTPQLPNSFLLPFDGDG